MTCTAPTGKLNKASVAQEPIPDKSDPEGFPTELQSKDILHSDLPPMHSFGGPKEYPSLPKFGAGVNYELFKSGRICRNY